MSPEERLPFVRQREERQNEIKAEGAGSSETPVKNKVWLVKRCIQGFNMV